MVSDRITICGQCDGGADLAARVPGAVTGGCMNVCARPATVAVQGAGKVAWLFGGVTPAMAGDLAAFAALYAAAPEGHVTDARPAGDLRFCLLGCLPAYP